ncbi:DUF2231 domain-containing protein [Nonomuraea sp. PA05]|uniref:DUF2231 domain-containing protein n=1 Tax=Nonomuraea sp. PA05 TaxID=2604466 RepID=UPI0011D30047|nr:DUF2231 domain-containing protein [Nonomuraea sp. PA05]TYB64739.1 DUF2231 domain-containing protein [Nonomuraea sp. PA05]
MDSKAKALGHPVHPMLIVFPLGLLVTAAIFDILHLITNGSGFPLAAGYAIAAGLIGGVVAGVFGLIDWVAIPAGSRAKRIGALHGIGNVLVLLLFAGSWWLRTGTDWVPTVPALILSFAGVALGAASGWMGGELVDRLGVGVDEGANVNAPSSLSGGPATR